MKNILISSHDVFFRAGVLRILEQLLGSEGQSLFEKYTIVYDYRTYTIMDADYIFIDSSLDDLFFCHNKLRAKKCHAFAFIFKDNIPPIPLPTCYTNTWFLCKSDCVNKIYLQLYQMLKFPYTSTKSSCDGCPYRHKLSQQQQKLIQYMISGISNNKIAELMNINYKTVLSHRNRIMKKYKIEKRRDLYILLGLIDKNLS
ncbi:TPA: hypothetical protein JDL67_005085 [Salmonella enterica subsp. salamae]|nr:hypothetical protein [Salmonella enterica subsp. salamae]